MSKNKFNNKYKEIANIWLLFLIFPFSWKWWGVIQEQSFSVYAKHVNTHTQKKKTKTYIHLYMCSHTHTCTCICTQAQTQTYTDNKNIILLWVIGHLISYSYSCWLSYFIEKVFALCLLSLNEALEEERHT